MNAIATPPVPGPAIEVPVIPDIPAMLPNLAKAPRHIADTLWSIYAYALIVFGLSFPWLLAAWTVLVGFDSR